MIFRHWIPAWLLAATTGRSPRWPTVRNIHLKMEPCCRACGASSNLEVHHVFPFHVRPDLELDPDNLVTLCESPAHNCHLIFGHLLSWQSWNVDVFADAASFRAKVSARPGANKP